MSGSSRAIFFSVFASTCSLSFVATASEILQNKQDDQQSLRAFLPQWMSHTQLHWQRPHLQIGSGLGDFYSQSAEDTTAEQLYFHNIQNGVFVEMGALDGNTFSNTKFFEETRGWRGLLIEPSRVNFEKIIVNKSHAIGVNAAICAQRQIVHFVENGIHLCNSHLLRGRFCRGHRCRHYVHREYNNSGKHSQR